MKRFSILILLFSGAALLQTSCTTPQGDAEAPQGISGEGLGFTRESVYQWQDKTFRELAY